MERLTLSAKFTSLACLGKFVCWPILTAIILILDRQFFGLFSQSQQQIIFFMSSLPLAANTVAIAAQLETEPDKAAVAVLISTLAALVIVPFYNTTLAALLLGVVE